MATPRAVLRFMLRNAKRLAVTIVGSVLVIVGVVGLLLPVIPGWALIFVGLAVLATEYAWARRALDKAREKAKQAARRVRGGPRDGVRDVPDIRPKEPPETEQPSA